MPRASFLMLLVLPSLIAAARLAPLSASADAAGVNVTVDLGSRRAISPTLFGIFFEEVRGS
jgi:hypothetical protein